MKKKVSAPRQAAPRGRMALPNVVRAQFLKVGDEVEKAFVLAFWKEFIPNRGDFIVIGPANRDDDSNIFRIVERIFYFDSHSMNTGARMIIEPWNNDDIAYEADLQSETFDMEKLRELYGSEIQDS